MQKLGCFGGLGVTQGHQKHSHSIVHTTSYSTSVEAMRLILYRFRVIARFSRKWPIFTHPTCIVAPVVHISP